MRFPHGMADTSRARLLSRALLGAGADVRVICLQASERPPLIENVERRGTWMGVPFEYTAPSTVRHDSFLARRLLAACGWAQGALRLAQLRRGGCLDVVYLWMWAPRPGVHRYALLGFLKALGIPVVMELNEYPWPLREDVSSLGRRLSPLAGVSGVVSISAMLSRWAGEAARGRRLEIVQVPIVVDTDEVVPAPYPDGDPVLVFAGSPVYDDTIRFLVATMRHVWEAVPACRLVITGANPGDPAALWLHQELEPGLDSRVEVAGYLPRAELLALYTKAHALLIPLFDDARSRARFPTKIAEYLAAARPVVTTAVGEVSEYLEDGRDAIVCPPGDPLLYAQNILRVLADSGLAADVGRNGRALAERLFDYRLYGPALRDAFAAVAGRGEPAPTEPSRERSATA